MYTIQILVTGKYVSIATTPDIQGAMKSARYHEKNGARVRVLATLSRSIQPHKPYTAKRK